MNVLELADFYETQNWQMADMLRKQDAVIKQLKEALLMCKQQAGTPENVYKISKAVLEATEIRSMK